MYEYVCVVYECCMHVHGVSTNMKDRKLETYTEQFTAGAATQQTKYPSVHHVASLFVVCTHT